jgi:hypothetical protein
MARILPDMLEAASMISDSDSAIQFVIALCTKKDLGPKSRKHRRTLRFVVGKCRLV